MRQLAQAIGVIALVWCTGTAYAGAVGGPKSIPVSLGYLQNNSQTVTIEFEGQKEARVTVTGTVRGYSVVFGPNGKQFFGRLGPMEGQAARWGIRGSWNPGTTSKFHIQIINDDNDAKKDATFLIETN